MIDPDLTTALTESATALKRAYRAAKRCGNEVVAIQIKAAMWDLAGALADASRAQVS
jgi:DNA integrity scanning protein DisA with diadenylate cyclase activity